MNKTFLQHLQKNKRKYKLLILPLISSAAVLRKERILKKLLLSAKINKIDPRKIYEALLQTYLFAGFPSALVALKISFDIFPLTEFRIEPEALFKKVGVVNCKKIYGNKFEKLISNVEKFSPELSKWLITEGYGKVMGRKGLSLKEREMCNVAVLCSLKYDSQLYSHINGAIRLKNTRENIRALITNLEQVGSRRISRFGMTVFNSYFKNRNKDIGLN